MKRIFLFGLVNIAVIFLFSIVLILLQVVFGINVAEMAGQGYTGLLIYAGIFGFLGAFFSLFISKWMAKRTYGITPLTESDLYSLSTKEKLVWDTVMEISNKHGITMPEVGIYRSQDPNAFATGATKNSSLVAVSTGLLNLMTEDEIEAVVAHEMAHILNGDMVTMTLLQGVMNTFVIFFARILATMFDRVTEGKFGQLGFFGIYIVLQIVLGIVASVVVMWFSRHREFRADEGASRYVGKEKMIRALQALKRVVHPKEDPKFATMQISTQTTSGFKKLFMSHPPLEERIRNLDNFRY
ncbi:protease HtpX [Candidatus Gracilibacteria bacterium]|nr:protease HtpX [Candidatus Gracilibacteria bacterium]